MNKLTIITKHAVSKVLHYYADARIGASYDEKHCYKRSDSILFTFDDFGSKEEIVELLDILRANNVKAMFFLQGDWADSHPDIVGLIKQANHILGNHTYTHANLKRLSASDRTAEITKGISGPWLRPPQGRYNDAIRKVANELGYYICYWTIDSRDWTGATVEVMEYTILTEVKPGAVILFHINGRHTRELLPGLILHIRKQGYRITDFTESWCPTT